MAAERGGAREGGEGGGFSRVENRVGLGVAVFTRGALEPDDVGAGVEDHVEVFGGRADADAGEVLVVALGEAGDDGGAEAGHLSNLTVFFNGQLTTRANQARIQSIRVYQFKKKSEGQN